MKEIAPVPNPQMRWPTPAKAWNVITLLLILAIVHGMLYSAITPLGQSPDEPSHLEYIKLIQEQRRLPDKNAVSLELRREIIASELVGTNFNRYFYPLPAGSLLLTTPPDIPGPSELVHPPAYYILGALTLLPFSHQDIATQAYIARLVSVLLSALAVLGTFLTARELFPHDSFLQLGIPLLIVFIPARTFIDSMINDDVAAELVMAFQFAVWARIFRRGFSIRRALALVMLIVAGLWVKRTTAFAIPLAVIALIVYHWNKTRKWQRNYRLLVPLLTTVALLLAGALCLTPVDALGWESRGSITPVRANDFAHSGVWAMRVQAAKPGQSARIEQVLPPRQLDKLAGQTLTLSAWVRTPAGEQRGYLALDDGTQWSTKEFTATTTWQRHELTARVALTSTRLVVNLGIPKGADSALYFDDISLTPRSTQVAMLPLAGPANFIRNGGGESAQWDLRPQIYRLLNKVLHLRVSPGTVRSILDWQRSLAYRETYWMEIRGLFTSFWAIFAVRQIQLGSGWYIALLLLCLLAVTGWARLLIRRWRGKQTGLQAWQGQVLCMFAIAAGMVIVLTILRIHPLPTTYVPHGRYLYVAVVPITTLLLVGWRELLPQTWRRSALLWGLLGFFTLDTLALACYVLPFFYAGGHWILLLGGS